MSTDSSSFYILIVPILFLILVFEIVIGIISAAIGVCFIDVCIVGYLRTNVSWALRLIMLAGGVMMVIPSYALSAAGLVVGGGAFLLAWQKRNVVETR